MRIFVVMSKVRMKSHFLAQDINHLYVSLIQTIEVLELEVAKTKELEQAKSEFMQIASHELKTPVKLH